MFRPLVNLTRSVAVVALAVAALLSAAAPSARAQALGTSFTYQGSLAADGSSLTGNVDLRFSLWSAASGPGQVGTTQQVLNVPVSQGQFTATIDFGSVFQGQQRWLQVEVRSPAFTGGGAGPAFTVLTPRQPVGAVPYALFALNTANPSPLSPSGSNYVLSNGNLGLGIDPPTFKLSVNGAVQSATGGFVFPDGSTQTIAAVNGLRGIREFVATGDTSFTVPEGVTNLMVEAWGAGGGGAGGYPGFWSGNQATSFGGGSGGAGGNGGYARTILTVAPGQVLTMRVGVGGALGPGSSSLSFPGGNGSAGGATQVLNGSTVLMTCPGGAGGTGGSFTPASGPGLGGQPGAGGTVPDAPIVAIRRNGAAGGVGFSTNFASTVAAPGGSASPVVSGTLTPAGGQGGAGGAGGAIFLTGGGGGLVGSNGTRGQNGYIIVHW